MKYILVLRSGIAYGPFDSEAEANAWANARDLVPGWRVHHLYTPEAI